MLVEGRLQFRSYSTDGGGTRKAAEVVAASVEFLDRGKEGNEAVDAAAAFGRDVTVGWRGGDTVLTANK